MGEVTETQIDLIAIFGEEGLFRVDAEVGDEDVQRLCLSKEALCCGLDVTKRVRVAFEECDGC